MSVAVKISGDIAVVTIANPPVNALGQNTRSGLLDALAETDKNASVRAVVLTGEGGQFCGGADVREFTAPPAEPFLPDVLAQIEQASKPWIAAIEGVALGGGLELALACHYRIASQGAKLGLPEVKLGLIPGAGGTVRLPRLVPADHALQMIASGEMVTADAARNTGLIDVIATGAVLTSAMDFARRVSDHSLPRPLSERDARLPSNPLAFDTAKAVILRRAGGAIAPGVAVGTVEKSVSSPAAEALAVERANFLSLKASDQCAALRHVFFAEREVGRIEQARGVAPLPLRRIGVVGGGTMGAGIAAACLLSGLSVNMVERDETALSAGLARVRDALDGAYKRGKITKQSLQHRIEALRGEADYAACADCDLIIEAVFEDMAVKRDVFQKLDAHTRPDTILATNTSYLDVNEIASATSNPGRVIGLHFFSPAHVMKLLEIVIADDTSPQAVATGVSLAKRLGKTYAAAGVCDGFIGNRIMSAYRREADYLIEDGALPQEVDRAMTDFGFPMGVFAMQDLAGLDIAWAMRKRRAATRAPEERYVDIADRLCEMGRLGRKTGKGWYDYSASKTGSPDSDVQRLIEAESSRKGITRKSIAPDVIMGRLLAAMRSEGRRILDEGIAASPGVIDVVMINGFGFPRWRGGPMFGVKIDELALASERKQPCPI